MTEPTWFTVSADYKSVVADLASDSDYDPQLGPVSATVTFTPMLATGDVILVPDADPRPTAYVGAPIVARIDTDGRLKLRVDPDEDGTGTFAPVRLLADVGLNLATPLFYRVTFTNVIFNGQPGYLNGFVFQAPDSDLEINLVEVGREPGQTAVGIVRLAPTSVRQNEDDLTVFAFGGVDINSPLDLRGPTGDTGPAGSAASVSVGTVSTGNAGSSAAVTNAGTSSAAVLNFTLPKGDKGDTGNTGSAATISVGSVSTGNAGSSASVTNVGTSGAAVFDITIPRGDKGDTGNTGSTGSAATVSVGTVSTGNAGSSASVTNVGTSSAATFDFTIPRGDKGETGNTGSTGNTGAAATIAVGTVTTVAPGSSASVTNVGTSSAAVFDISIPKGDTGSADASTWSTLDGKPAVIAAGATKADARSAIDAEYTGNRGTANGYASLDSAGKVPYTQLPASIMSYLGTWSATTNSPTLADGTGDAGDLYRVATAGTRNLGSGSITYGVGDYVIYNGTTWEKSDSTDAVASVNGYTGVVTLTKSDVGLSAVDNTADADKPISSATSTALGGKEPTIAAGSTGQYWDGTKTWTTLNKSAVGLGNVDNTTDLGKPISTATQTALDGKEPTISGGISTQYYRGDKTFQTLDKSAVGLGNVDNTADASKTVSAAATLSTGRTFQTDLASTTAASFDGSANNSHGVTGTLPVGNGGTGVTTLTGLVKGTGTTAMVAATAGTDYVAPGGALGTPSSATLTNATGLPVSGIAASTSAALGVGSVELGHATDTTLTRSAAGVLAVEGVDVVTTSGTQTLTNKTAMNPTITNYTESVVAIGTVSSASTLSLTSGTVQTATLTASTACTFTMPSAVAGKSFVLMLKQAASTGNGTATFTGVKWGTSGAPTITATAGKMDILSFFSDGTNWYGSVAAGYTP